MNGGKLKFGNRLFTDLSTSRLISSLYDRQMISDGGFLVCMMPTSHVTRAATLHTNALSPKNENF